MMYPFHGNYITYDYLLTTLELRKLVEKLPQLQDIVRALGRFQLSQSDEVETERIMEPVERLEEELQERPTPLIPHETRGVKRSGKIERMLPAEAAMLGHPKLKVLWHARRAENALLTYRVQGIECDRTWKTVEDTVEKERKKPRLERGPVIAVIDTSGSMSGTPELVAKAVVLEAMRLAHKEKRHCYLYAYSGPNQVLEHELALTDEGMKSLLDFLAMSFGGGTDIGAMSQVVKRLNQETWKKADVVLVTDGEWRASAGICRKVTEAKEDKGSRFHGVQIGNSGRTGLHDLCDPVHIFSEWSKLGGW